MKKLIFSAIVLIASLFIVYGAITHLSPINKNQTSKHAATGNDNTQAVAHHALWDNLLYHQPLFTKTLSPKTPSNSVNSQLDQVDDQATMSHKPRQQNVLAFGEYAQRTRANKAEAIYKIKSSLDSKRQIDIVKLTMAKSAGSTKRQVLIFPNYYYDKETDVFTWSQSGETDILSNSSTISIASESEGGGNCNIKMRVTFTQGTNPKYDEPIVQCSSSQSVSFIRPSAAQMQKIKNTLTLTRKDAYMDEIQQFINETTWEKIDFDVINNIGDQYFN